MTRPSRNACALGAEHLVVVVEAVEVVGDADRVVRDRVRAAPLGRLGDDGRELGEPLDQVALLGARARPAARPRRRAALGVAEDPGDPGVGVLDVVDGVLRASSRPRGRRRSRSSGRARARRGTSAPRRRRPRRGTRRGRRRRRAASTSSPPRRRWSGGRAGRAAPRRARGRSRASARRPRTSCACRGGRRRARRSRGRSRGRACRRGRRRPRRGRSACPSRERISTRSSSSPYADERAQTAPSFSYVSSRGRNSGSRCSSSLCFAHESKWMRKRSSVSSIRCSICGTGSSGQLRQLGDVVAVVAVLGRLLPAPARLDRGAEAVHLRAGVVVVVLALDVVAGEARAAARPSRRRRRCGRRRR